MSRSDINYLGPRDQGMALISVLWALMVLSVMALSVLSVVRMQKQSTATLESMAQAEALADAGIYLAIQKLSEPGAVRTISDRKSSLSFRVQGNRVKVFFVPENGKIDLNASHEILISTLLIYHGLRSSDAYAITEVIRNARKDSSNKPYRMLSDIKQFREIGRHLYRCIEPDLTVYSNQLGVNYGAATISLQNMIKWADKKRLGGQNWLEIGGGAAGSLVSGTKSVLQQTGSYAGKAFTLQAEVALSEGVTIRRSAIIRLTGNRQDPFWVYRWSTTILRDEDRCKTADGR